MTLTINQKLKYCVIGNLVLLIGIITVLSVFGSPGEAYWRIGPNEGLVIISVKINNWSKYGTLLAFICVLKISQVIIAEVAHPIIGFNIYNPDKKVIKEFRKNELQFYGNTMYLIDAIRNVLMIMVSISQIDVALFGVIISEITSIFTIRMLLNEKVFEKDTDSYVELSGVNDEGERE